MSERDKDFFDQGYVIAVCNVIHLYSEEVEDSRTIQIAKTVLEEIDISAEEIGCMGLTEYDLAALRPLFPNDQHHHLQEADHAHAHGEDTPAGGDQE